MYAKLTQIHPSKPIILHAHKKTRAPARRRKFLKIFCMFVKETLTIESNSMSSNKLLQSPLRSNVIIFMDGEQMWITF